MVQSVFLHYILGHRLLIYVAIFIAMIIEGDAVVFATGFLVRQKFLDLGDTLFIILMGTLLGDVAWFLLGRKITEKPFFIGRWITKITSSFDNHIIKKTPHTILLSKFSYGLHHLLLTRAGMLKIRMISFIKSDLMAIPLWIIIVGGLGYLAGTAYASVKHSVRVAEVGLFIAIVVFIVTEKYIIGGEIRKKL